MRNVKERAGGRDDDALATDPIRDGRQCRVKVRSPDVPAVDGTKGDLHLRGQPRDDGIPGLVAARQIEMHRGDGEREYRSDVLFR